MATFYIVVLLTLLRKSGHTYIVHRPRTLPKTNSKSWNFWPSQKELKYSNHPFWEQKCWFCWFQRRYTLQLTTYQDFLRETPSQMQSSKVHWCQWQRSSGGMTRNDGEHRKHGYGKPQRKRQVVWKTWENQKPCVEPQQKCQWTMVDANDTKIVGTKHLVQTTPFRITSCRSLPICKTWK